jgi:aldose 1-epimerase
MSDEIVLSSGRQRAVVSSHGASLRHYWIVQHDGQELDVLWGYRGTGNKKGGQGDVLVPFPGRVRDGRYRFGGQEHQLRRNDKDGPNAIHGFVRTELWQVLERAEARARFGFRIEEGTFEGYPFRLDIEVAYSLSAAGLECGFEVRNAGAKEAPFGAGFHPYFTVGTTLVDEAEARIPAERLVELGPDLLPTGAVAEVKGGKWDFRDWRKVKDSKFNHCYTALARDAGGLARAGLRDPATGRQISVWMDQAFDYLVVYTGDTIPAPHARRALAIEPMTCGTDAFNHPEWGLIRLKPGERRSGRYGVTELL